MLICSFLCWLTYFPITFAPKFNNKLKKYVRLSANDASSSSTQTKNLLPDSSTSLKTMMQIWLKNNPKMSKRLVETKMVRMMEMMGMMEMMEMGKAKIMRKMKIEEVQKTKKKMNKNKRKGRSR